MHGISALRLKHQLAVSPLGIPAARIRRGLKGFSGQKHPELSLLHAEDAIIEQAFRKLLRRGDRCLDIGAHIGFVAHQLEVNCGHGRVKLFEAVPEKAEWLKKRLGEDNVFSCALGSETGTVDFFVDDNRPGFSSVEARSGQYVRKISVDMRRLDDVLPDDEIAFIKIDVEGHELAVLQSGRVLLERSRPILLFEAGAISEATSDKTDALFDWLTEEMSYDVVAAFEYGHRQMSLTKEQFRLYRSYPYLAFNYFAVPSGSGRDQ